MEAQRPSGLSSKKLLYFSLGDLGYQFVFYWISALLMIFYTDVFLIPAASVSVLMLVVRLYDAINDPIIGSLMDRSHSKLGRYRPWIIVGGIGLSISTILMFWAHPEWSLAAKNVYMYTTYIIVVTFSTMFYMAYMALNGFISVDASTRTRASSARMVMSYIGMLLVGYAAPFILEYSNHGNPTIGYLIGITLSAILGLPMMLICGLGSKEVIQLPQEKVKIPLHKQWSALIHNRPMLILTICMFVHGIQMNGRLMIATYYCTYVLNSIAALSIFNLLNAISAVIGALIAPTLARKCGNKGVVSAIILYLCAFSMVLQYTTAANLILFYLLVSITGLCYGGFSTLMFSMIPDSVDYAQFKFGVRVDGFLNAVASFGFKVGGAISISATGLLLSFYGYIPNSPQSPECLNTITILMTLFPAAGCTIAGTLLLFYKINNGKHQEIIHALKERHAI